MERSLANPILSQKIKERKLNPVPFGIKANEMAYAACKGVISSWLVGHITADDACRTILDYIISEEI